MQPIHTQAAALHGGSEEALPSVLPEALLFFLLFLWTSEHTGTQLTAVFSFLLYGTLPLEFTLLDKTFISVLAETALSVWFLCLFCLNWQVKLYVSSHIPGCSEACGH